jgi:hypothetical protein
VWIDNNRVADFDLIERHVADNRVSFPMCNGGHSFCQRAQHRRCIAQCVVLQRLAAGEHQHDDRAGQIFVEQDRSDNRDSREQIGAEFST